MIGLILFVSVSDLLVLVLSRDYIFRLLLWLHYYPLNWVVIVLFVVWRHTHKHKLNDEWGSDILLFVQMWERWMSLQTCLETRIQPKEFRLYRCIKSVLDGEVTAVLVNRVRIDTTNVASSQCVFIYYLNSLKKKPVWAHWHWLKLALPSHSLLLFSQSKAKKQNKPTTSM